MYDWNNKEIWTNQENWANQRSNSLILTFDDGPSSVLIPLLDILKKHDVQAMFFWQSRLLHKNRPWKRVLEEGHMIGGHSLRHRDLTRLSRYDQQHDIETNIKHIESLTGQKIKYFRPPFGQFNEDTLHVLKELDVVPFLWEVAGLDWELKNNPNQIVHNIVNHAEDGSVILLHELKQTLMILDDLIYELKKEGYQFILPPK
ncbi:polysaccharide deacetylase family protein [Fictibacillus sp. b24]|uniref:polysaccharide deacetylase family protein n=1 Tax=Fictibacillus sp. b24 TaxID=3055863 RepID=UPI0025A17A30|nr:polysaccharide deacetylase family protein [Fictibacillus sp. b24]MDM5317795.1 polysaccharide deacetylase family protein [Fictibacillus sp. b24]